MRKRNHLGFTLVELLVVVAIISMLTAIALPNVLKFLRQAKMRTAFAQIRQIETAFNAYLAGNTQASVRSLGRILRAQRAISNLYILGGGDQPCLLQSELAGVYGRELIGRSTPPNFASPLGEPLYFDSMENVATLDHFLAEEMDQIPIRDPWGSRYIAILQDARSRNAPRFIIKDPKNAASMRWFTPLFLIGSRVNCTGGCHDGTENPEEEIRRPRGGKGIYIVSLGEDGCPGGPTGRNDDEFHNINLDFEIYLALGAGDDINNFDVTQGWTLSY